MSQAKPILIEISPGELFDKITVLEVKLERINDPSKLANIRVELSTLEEARTAAIRDSRLLRALVEELRGVNAHLYDIIEAIYACEAAGHQDWEKYVGLARSVYRLNDRRASLKRRINELLGSRLIEEKGHAIEASGISGGRQMLRRTNGRRCVI